MRSGSRLYDSLNLTYIQSDNAAAVRTVSLRACRHLSEKHVEESNGTDEQEQRNGEVLNLLVSTTWR